MPIEMTSVTPTGSTSQGAGIAGGELGKDEFLQLLTTQMRYQDPLNPMDSTAMIAQLAQFSALEQMQNVSDSVNASRRESGLIQSMLLQGREVSAVTDGGVEVQGTVERVVWGTDGLSLAIGGLLYPLNKLANLALVPETPSGDGVLQNP